MCAANAVVQKDPSGNRKLDKAKATGRIDGMVAMGMAFGATVLAAADLEPERTYQLFIM
jgi:phage terminase large subunit-like protein